MLGDNSMQIGRGRKVGSVENRVGGGSGELCCIAGILWGQFPVGCLGHLVKPSVKGWPTGLRSVVSWTFPISCPTSGGTLWNLPCLLCLVSCMSNISLGSCIPLLARGYAIPLTGRPASPALYVFKKYDFLCRLLGAYINL